MHPATRLDDLAHALARARADGTVPVAAAFRQAMADGLGEILAPRLANGLDAVLTRLESSGLFAEESCSFSQRDLLDALDAWIGHARAALPVPPPHAPLHHEPLQGVSP